MSPNLAFNKSQLNSNKFQLLQPLQPSSQNSWEFLAGVPRWEPGGDRCPPALGTLEQRPWERKGAEGISCCPLLGLPWGKERRPGKPSQNSPSGGKTPLLFPPTLPRAQPQHPMEMEVPPWGLRSLALLVAQLFLLPSFLLLKVLPQGFPGSVCS